MKKIIPVTNLIEIYKNGFFPMAENKNSQEINFFKPKLRFIIPLNQFHLSKKLYRLFKKSKYTYKINYNFEQVIYNCQQVKRKPNSTWINDIIANTYLELFKIKKCHSVECYEGKKMIGGLYGVQIGGCFFGESMFSLESNTSKFCLLYLMAILRKNSFSLLDSQFYNEHLIQFGAYEITNKDYMLMLKKSLKKKCKFNFIEDFHEVLSLIQASNQRS